MHFVGGSLRIPRLNPNGHVFQIFTTKFYYKKSFFFIFIGPIGLKVDEYSTNHICSEDSVKGLPYIYHTSVTHRERRGRPKPDGITLRLAMSWTVTTVHNVARLGEAGPRVWCMPCGSSINIWTHWLDQTGWWSSKRWVLGLRSFFNLFIYSMVVITI